MALKSFNPITPSQRAYIQVSREGLWRGKPVKELTEGLNKSGGRNNNGRTTMYTIGGGHKQRYRLVDFKRRKFGVAATVERLEYDPNRSAFIALIKYTDGELAYILAPQGLNSGDKVEAGEKVDIKPGNAMLLKNIPVGSLIHNIELKIGAGGKLARSAGASAQLIGRDQGYAQIRMASGEVRTVWGDCMASIGAVSNPDRKNVNYGKAGRSRWRGKRPVVRGIAMNPVDHPNGGRTNGGKHWATPWGVSTKGKKTRNNKRTDGVVIQSRHQKKKA